MLTLVLGGARSGKSSYAQSLCASSSEVDGLIDASRRAENSMPAGDVIISSP
jgi:adenosyl cobinamide kinase/adenosyl cobinamide phosphate guanylyltransferase